MKQLPQIAMLRAEPPKRYPDRAQFGTSELLFVATLGNVAWYQVCRYLDVVPFPLAPPMSPRLIAPPWFVARRR